MHSWFDRFPEGNVLGNHHMALVCAHLLKPGWLNLFYANAWSKRRWITLRLVQTLGTFHRLANLPLIVLAIKKCICKLHERKDYMVQRLTLKNCWLLLMHSLSSGLWFLRNASISFCSFSPLIYFYCTTYAQQSPMPLSCCCVWSFRR